MIRHYITTSAAFLSLFIVPAFLGMVGIGLDSEGIVDIPKWVFFYALPIVTALGFVYFSYGFRIFMSKPIVYHVASWLLGLASAALTVITAFRLIGVF